MSLLCYPLFLFYKLLNMFRATMCPSSGADSLPAATAQHQHVAITLRSRQLLKMGTWLPETCWATCKWEIKDNTKVIFSWFLIHTELRCTVNHISDLPFNFSLPSNPWFFEWFLSSISLKLKYYMNIACFPHFVRHLLTHRIHGKQHVLRISHWMKFSNLLLILS